MNIARLGILILMAATMIGCTSVPLNNTTRSDAAVAPNVTPGKSTQAVRPTQQRESVLFSEEPLVSLKPIAARPGNGQVIGRWKIHSGDEISEVFQAWSKATGKWQLAWEAPKLIAQVDIDLECSFEDAVARVIGALNRNGAGLQAKFYAPNQVLRIMEKK